MSLTAPLNHTHDLAARSWVASANFPLADFPLQNLPFASARRRGSSEAFRGMVAIGDAALDLGALAERQLISGQAAAALNRCRAPALNDLMAMDPHHWSALRAALFDLLRDDSPHQHRVQSQLISRATLEFALPARIGDYTDFYSSIHHASRVGALFRPDQPLLPNYRWVPIAYHGRSSSIAVSGELIVRPRGQLAPAASPGGARAADGSSTSSAPPAAIVSPAPTLGPSRRLDYEVELGIFVGGGNARFESIGMAQAEDHVFGLCLLNDWSARDLQAWEYQPLGPFLAKNFATTISPWIVTTEALAPFRCAFRRPAGEPEPLDYLDSASNRLHGAFDICLEASLLTVSMRERGISPQRVSLANFNEAYWTVSQLVTHHTVNGCNLQPGDLLGTGTQSGAELSAAGSLLELTRGGKEPLSIAGETRTFLEDGDTVILRGWCQHASRRIGFGEAAGTIVASQRT